MISSNTLNTSTIEILKTDRTKDHITKMSSMSVPSLWLYHWFYCP